MLRKGGQPALSPLYTMKNLGAAFDLLPMHRSRRQAPVVGSRWRSGPAEPARQAHPAWPTGSRSRLLGGLRPDVGYPPAGPVRRKWIDPPRRGSADPRRDLHLKIAQRLGAGYVVLRRCGAGGDPRPVRRLAAFHYAIRLHRDDQSMSAGGAAASSSMRSAALNIELIAAREGLDR